MDAIERTPGHSVAGRLAFGAASASVALSLLGSAVVMRGFSQNALNPTIRAWMAFNLLLPSSAMFFSFKSWKGPLWACAGAMLTFVVLGAMSIGPTYFPAAGALLVAAIAQPSSRRTKSGVWVLVPFLWLLAGLSGLLTFLRLLAWWQSGVTEYSWSTPHGFGHVYQAHSVSVAPMEVWGCWMFAAVCALLVVIYWSSAVSRRSSPIESS